MMQEMLKSDAYSDYAIISVLKTMAKGISEESIGDFFRLAARVKSEGKVLQIPELPVYHSEGVIAVLRQLGENYYYLAITQKRQVRCEIGQLLFDSSLKFTKYEHFIRQLELGSLRSSKTAVSLQQMQRKEPTACEELCVELLQLCQHGIETSVFSTLSQYLQYCTTLEEAFVQEQWQEVTSALLASFVGENGKDEQNTKLNIVQLLLELPLRPNLEWAVSEEEFTDKIAELSNLQQIKQVLPKLEYLQHVLFAPRRSAFSKYEDLVEFSDRAKQFSDLIELQLAICQFSELHQEDYRLLSLLCRTISASKFCVLEVEQLLDSGATEMRLLRFALQQGSLQYMSVLQYYKEASYLTQILRVFGKQSVDYCVLTDCLQKVDFQVLKFLDVSQAGQFIKCAGFVDGFKEFLQKELESYFVISDYEKQLMHTTELVDVAGIEPQEEIKKGMSLKQEQEIKSKNRQMLELADTRAQEEEAQRRELKEMMLQYFSLCSTILSACKRSAKAFITASATVLSSLIECSALFNSAMGLAKEYSEVVSLALSLRTRHLFIPGRECQVILLNIIARLVDPEYNEFSAPLTQQYHCYVDYRRALPIPGLISIDLECRTRAPFSELALQQAIVVYSAISHLLNIKQKSALAQYLSNSYNFLIKRENSVDDAQTLQLVFQLVEVNEYVMIKIVENLVVNHTLRGKAFQQAFLTPILDGLVVPDDQRKQLAYESLSHIPTNVLISIDRQHQFKLLLAEYLGDSVKRFFLAAGGRIQYISFLRTNMKELFENCFYASFNSYYLELLPQAIETICEEISDAQFIAEVATNLLEYHFKNEQSLENSRFDTDSFPEQKMHLIRRCIWTIFDKISKLLISYNQRIDENIPVGLLCYSYSDKFPPVCKIEPNLEQAELANRISCLSRAIKNKNAYQIVNSIYEKRYLLEMLQRHNKVYVEADPTQLTLLGTVFERYLHNGLFDYDSLTYDAAKNCILSIITQMGTLYNQQIEYYLETNRQSMISQVKLNPIIYSMVDRLMEFAVNIKQNGIPLQQTVDAVQLRDIDNSIIGTIIEILGVVSSQLLYEDDYRGLIIAFIERMISHAPLDYLSNLSRQCEEVWVNVLTSEQIKNPKVPKYDHQRYENSRVFAIQFLLPRYVDTVKFSSKEYPGAVYCLVGIIKYLGLSFVFQRENIIETTTCFCLKQSDFFYQEVGLQMIASLIRSFGRKIEPYYSIFIKDILYLSATTNPVVQNMTKQVINIMLKNLSSFGVSSVMTILVDALKNDVDWELKKGACDLTYQLCSNSAKIPLSEFRQLMAKMLPVLLPALQPNIYHSHYEVKESAINTIEKVADSVQNQQIKQISKDVINAYSEALNNRQILIKLSEMTFTHELDAASLTLVYPIIDRVLSTNSSFIYSCSNDKYKNTHTKILACSCVSLLSEISKQQDFKQYIPRLVSLLKKNLGESNEEIRTAVANSIADILTNYKTQSAEIENELWQFASQQLSCQQEYGIAQALVNLSIKNETWDNLLINFNILLHEKYNYSLILTDEEHSKSTNCQSLDIICMSLMLLYFPQKLISDDNSKVTDIFIKKYFSACFEFIFFIIELQEVEIIEDQIYKMARQLATSFLHKEFEIQLVVREITRNMIIAHEKSRLLAITLVGDVISELGCTDSKDSNEIKEELKQMREDLITVSFEKEEKKQQKVFIPEEAVTAAINAIGEPDYYKLMATLFVIRCDETHGIRTASVSMWKLVTFKPITAITGFIPYLLDVLSDMLDKHYYQHCSTDEFDYRHLVQSIIQELFVTIPLQPIEQFVDILYKQLDNEELSDKQLLFLLDVFIFIAQADNSSQFIRETLINKLPLLLSNSSNKLIINSTAELLTNLNCNVSSLLEQFINPEIVRLHEVTTSEEIKDVVESVLLMCQTEPELASLLDYSLASNMINDNVVAFYEEFFEKSTICRQEYQLYLFSIINELTKESAEAVITKDTFDLESEECNVFFKILMHSLSLAKADEILFEDMIAYIQKFVFDNINQVTESLKLTSLILSILLLRINPVDSSENNALVMVIINAIVSNTNNESMFPIIGQLLSALEHMFDCLCKDYTLELKEFLEVFINEFYLNLKRVIPMFEAHQLFIHQNKQMIHLFQVFCWVISSGQNTSDFEKEQAIKSMIHMELLTLSTLAVNTNERMLKFTYDDLHFDICVNADSSKLIILLSSAIIGRVILTFKEEVSDNLKVILCNTINTEFQLCTSLEQFEIAIRTDIERKCLMGKGQELINSAVACLQTLFEQSLRKENNVISLVSLLFTQEQQLKKVEQSNVVAVLTTLQKIIRSSTLDEKIISKPGEVQFAENQIYIELSDLLYRKICLESSNLLDITSKTIAECLLCDRQQNAGFIEKLIQAKDESLQAQRAELMLLEEIICTSINANLLKECQPILLEFEPSFISFLLEKSEFCPDSQLEVLGRTLCTCAWAINYYTLAGEKKESNEARDCYSRISAIITKKLNVCSREAKQCAVRSLLELSNIEKEEVRKEIGIVAVDFMQCLLMDKDVGVEAENAVIEYYRLRIGPDEYNAVHSIISLGDVAIANDMKHRIEEMCKQIKSGKL